MPELGSWVYAVTAADAERLPPGLRGVAGEPVHGLPCDGVTAVVGTVRLDRFGAEPLRRALSDAAVLERLARAHHEVNRAVAGRAATVPFRMATICLGDQRVRELLAGHRQQLDAALERVAGRAEWGVRAHLEPVPEPVSTLVEAGKAGTAYLMRRRGTLMRREQAYTGAGAAYDALAARAVAAVSHAVPPGSPDLLFNASFLVDDARLDEFIAAVEALSHRDGVRLTLTGPWPPYAFADVAGAR
jgi:hypothetical protein